MILAHLPAGYILTSRLLDRERDLNYRVQRRLLLWGLLCSVLPDFDMFYFYLIDNRQHLHHGYWTHLPVFWCGMALFLYLYALLRKRRVLRLFTVFGFYNIATHLLLDTVTGKIRWFYPLSDRDVVFFHVPARYDWWVWNFILHWTFLFELALIGYAAYLFVNRRKVKQAAVNRLFSRTELL